MLLATGVHTASLQFLVLKTNISIIKMKKLLLSVVVLASLNSFAGPEDHVMAQKCYSLKDTTQVQHLTVYVPTQICLEELTIDDSKNTITIYSYFMADLFKNLKLDYFARKNEDFYRFRSSSRLADQAQVATNQDVTVDLNISGLVDNYGSTDLGDLEITVQQKKNTYPDDTMTETTVFEYSAQ